MNGNTAQQVVQIDVSHRAQAERLLTERYPHALDQAAVHAQLATADAIDRLTAALELMQFPTLEVKKCLTSVGYKIRPVKR